MPAGSTTIIEDFVIKEIPWRTADIELAVRQSPCMALRTPDAPGKNGAAPTERTKRSNNLFGSHSYLLVSIPLEEYTLQKGCQQNYNESDFNVRRRTHIL